MAPVTIPTTDFITAPNTVYDIIAQVIDRYLLHEFGFITSACSTKMFATLHGLYLNDMASVWVSSGWLSALFVAHA